VLLRGLARRRAPRWVDAAPTLRLAVANVFIDNEEPGSAARQLVETAAEVLVVTETTARFRAAFRSVGGDDRYPWCAFDSADTSDYAVSIHTTVEPVEIGMLSLGTLQVASVVLDVDGVRVRIVGTIPAAAPDPQGYPTWRAQVRALASFAARQRGPLVIAGDLNTTIHRAAYRELQAAGLSCSHDILGRALRPSFKLAAAGLLGRLGPLVRLDHALVNRSAFPREVNDLDPAGSDHRPFVVTLAVRRRAQPARRTRRTASVDSAAMRQPTVAS
jgi:endonuclease/exonuclease/phosphatase (EEP) superfamily protein YafD